MANGEETSLVHLLLEGLAAILSLLVGIGGWVLKGLSDKVDKHEAEIFDPDGALRSGDHTVRDDLAKAVSDVTKELRGVRNDLGDVRTALAAATGIKVISPRRVEED